MPHDMTARLARRVKLKDAHIITRMADIAEGLTDVIKLGRGDPDLDTPPHIVAAGQQALADGATHYTHPLGIPALRQAIADNIRAHGGADYAPDNIVVTPGGQQAMFVIALGLLDPGDEILVPCPGYNPYHQAAELSEAKVVSIRTTIETNFTLTAEMVRAHITPKSKILVLINPNNPTGTVTPPAEIARIAEVAREPSGPDRDRIRHDFPSHAYPRERQAIPPTAPRESPSSQWGKSLPICGFATVSVVFHVIHCRYCPHRGQRPRERQTRCPAPVTATRTGSPGVSSALPSARARTTAPSGSRTSIMLSWPW